RLGELLTSGHLLLLTQYHNRIKGYNRRILVGESGTSQQGPRFVVVLKMLYPRLAVDLLLGDGRVPGNIRLGHKIVYLSICNGFIVVYLAVIGNFAPLS